VSNDTVNEHVYIVNKRVSVSEKTGDLNSRPKQLRSEIMNYTLPRHRRKNNRRKVNSNYSTQFVIGERNEFHAVKTCPVAAADDPRRIYCRFLILQGSVVTSA